MNKFQKLALSYAKDHQAKRITHEGVTVQREIRNIKNIYLSLVKGWPYEKCVDYSRWSKSRRY